MHTEYLFINQRSHRKAVEAVCKYSPKFNIKSSFTLIVKAIYAVYGSTFMVASEKEEVFRVFYFVREEKAYCFEALLSAIYIIP